MCLRETAVIDLQAPQYYNKIMNAKATRFEALFATDLPHYGFVPIDRSAFSSRQRLLQRLKIGLLLFDTIHFPLTSLLINKSLYLLHMPSDHPDFPDPLDTQAEVNRTISELYADGALKIASFTGKYAVANLKEAADRVSKSRQQFENTSEEILGFGHILQDIVPAHGLFRTYPEETFREHLQQDLFGIADGLYKWADEKKTQTLRVGDTSDGDTLKFKAAMESLKRYVEPTSMPLMTEVRRIFELSENRLDEVIGIRALSAIHYRYTWRAVYLQQWNARKPLGLLGSTKGSIDEENVVVCPDVSSTDYFVFSPGYDAAMSIVVQKACDRASGAESPQSERTAEFPAPWSIGDIVRDVSLRDIAQMRNDPSVVNLRKTIHARDRSKSKKWSKPYQSVLKLLMSAATGAKYSRAIKELEEYGATWPAALVDGATRTISLLSGGAAFKPEFVTTLTGCQVDPKVVLGGAALTSFMAMTASLMMPKKVAMFGAKAVPPLLDRGILSKNIDWLAHYKASYVMDAPDLSSLSISRSDVV